MQEIWEKHTEGWTVATILAAYKNPSVWQSELSDYINNLENLQIILEAGCEGGVTSLLCKKEKRCFLDQNSYVMDLVKGAHGTILPYNIKDQFIVADMFNMPFGNNEFDLVFNSGVVEHLNSEEIVKALCEYKRVCKENGKIIIGIPNHYCFVYRSAYLWGMLLDKLKIAVWPWPKEFKYYNLKDEAEKAGLIFEKRFTLSRKSIWNWWRGRKYLPIRMLFKVRDKVKPYEGYLTVIQLAKSGQSER